MPSIAISDINLGGIADSPYQGKENSVAQIVGCDIHSEAGLIRASRALIKDTPETGVTLTDTRVMLHASDNFSYIFTGQRLYKRNGTTRAYTEVLNNADVEARDAIEYKGYIYWTTTDKLWRKPFPGLSDWSDRATVATLSTGTVFYPLKIKNDNLYIGNYDTVAVVDSTHTYTADALDLEPGYYTTALGEIENDLLVGTQHESNLPIAKIFRWNTYAVSWTTSDIVPEKSISAFVPVDNFVMVAAGRQGRLYDYDGYFLRLLKQVPEKRHSNADIVEVNPKAVASVFSRPLFGLSKLGVANSLQGIYSFAQSSAGYPFVLALDHIVSSGATTAITIYSMLTTPDDILIGWKDDNANTYHIDRIDTNLQDNAYIETRVIQPERIDLKDFQVHVGYRQLPENTDIEVYKKVNNGSYVLVPTRDDAKRSKKIGDVKIADAATLQLKVVMRTSGADAPEIENIILTW